MPVIHQAWSDMNYGSMECCQCWSCCLHWRKCLFWKFLALWPLAKTSLVDLSVLKVSILKHELKTQLRIRIVCYSHVKSYDIQCISMSCHKSYAHEVILVQSIRAIQYLKASIISIGLAFGLAFGWEKRCSPLLLRITLSDHTLASKRTEGVFFCGCERSVEPHWEATFKHVQKTCGFLLKNAGCYTLVSGWCLDPSGNCNTWIPCLGGRIVLKLENHEANRSNVRALFGRRPVLVLTFWQVRHCFLHLWLLWMWNDLACFALQPWWPALVEFLGVSQEKLSLLSIRFNKMQVCHAQVFNQQSQCKHTSAMAMAVEYQSCHVGILVQVQDRHRRIADLQKT